MSRTSVDVATFEEFVERSQARLLAALISTYGPADGQIATLDALSWAWENWSKLADISNPLGYLYRVGQSSARRHRSRPIPIDAAMFEAHGLPEVRPELIPALTQLSGQQRTAVMLVHGYGWTLRDVAAMLEVSPSTVQTHLERGVQRLRMLLEDADGH